MWVRWDTTKARVMENAIGTIFNEVLELSLKGKTTF